MYARILLAAFVACLLAVNVGTAQESTDSSFQNFDQFSATKSSTNSTIAPDAIDIGTAQRTGSSSATLFQTKTAPPATSVLASQTDAQQEVVASTLMIIGGGLLVGLVAFGAAAYWKRQDAFGVSRRNPSRW